MLGALIGILYCAGTEVVVPAGSISTRGAAGFEHFRIDGQLYVVSVSESAMVLFCLILAVVATQQRVYTDRVLRPTDLEL